MALINKLLEPEEEAKAGAAPKTTAAPVQRHPVNGGLGLITSITPTAFEKRDLGDVIRLSSAGDLTWQQARLAGLQNFNGELQAQFSTRELNASFRLVPGGTVFLGTLRGAEKTGSEFETKSETISLAFLTSRSLPMPEGKNLAKEAKDVQARLEVISVPKTIAAALMDEALNDSLLYSKLQARTTVLRSIRRRCRQICVRRMFRFSTAACRALRGPMCRHSVFRVTPRRARGRTTLAICSTASCD